MLHQSHWATRDSEEGHFHSTCSAYTLNGVKCVCWMFWPCAQVAHLNLPGSELFRKLRQLKQEKGGLTSQDERQYAQIRRSLEAEVLAHADVVRRPCCALALGAALWRAAAESGLVHKCLMRRLYDCTPSKDFHTLPSSVSTPI